MNARFSLVLQRPHTETHQVRHSAWQQALGHADETGVSLSWLDNKIILTAPHVVMGSIRWANALDNIVPDGDVIGLVWHVATYRAFVRVALNDDNLAPGLADIVAAPPDAVIYG
jgi:hypothetical protein